MSANENGSSAPEVRLLRDETLGRMGWTRRFTAAPPRLTEVMELYESLGHEVLLDSLCPGELAAHCEGCRLALSLFRVIYTRPIVPARIDWRIPASDARGEAPSR